MAFVDRTGVHRTMPCGEDGKADHRRQSGALRRAADTVPRPATARVVLRLLLGIPSPEPQGDPDGGPVGRGMPALQAGGAVPLRAVEGRRRPAALSDPR